MSEKIPQVSAFKQELKRSKYDYYTLNIDGKPETLTKDKLFEFTDSDRYIVRKVPEHCLDTESPNVINDARTAQNLYSELKTEYGIEAPVQLVVAKDESSDEESIFALTEHIKSVNYASDEDERENALKQYEKVWESLVAYYEAKAKSGEAFLIDLPTPQQFIYGRKNEETKARWYLIDTDPMFSKDKGELSDDIETLIEELSNIESICGKTLPNLQSRCETLLEKLNEVAPQERSV